MGGCIAAGAPARRRAPATSTTTPTSRTASTSSTSRRASSAGSRRRTGSPDDEVARVALEGFDPNAVVAFGPSEEVPLLAGKGFVDGRPAVYACERFACRAPVTEATALPS